MSNSNTNLQTQSSNALHNAIMEAGSKDRPPMLAPGNYVQWKSRIKRYIDTKPNSELIHYSLQNPPYIYQWAEKIVPVAEGSSETTTERYMENYKNVSQDIRDQLNAEAEAVQIILNRDKITISTPQVFKQESAGDQLMHNKLIGKDDTHDESDDQELEAPYMYMCTTSKSEHPEQPESNEVDTLKSQMETQKKQFSNEIDRFTGNILWPDHMNAILGNIQDLDEFTDLQCDYGETLEKCERLEKELSKSKTMSKNFESLQKHAINLELDLHIEKE
ncbi:hypothetical protein Tco_0223744 [Tanacetum coccineum]